MRNFQDTFETGKRSFITALSICMTVSVKIVFPLGNSLLEVMQDHIVHNEINQVGKERDLF